MNSRQCFIDNTIDDELLVQAFAQNFEDNNNSAKLVRENSNNNNNHTNNYKINSKTLSKSMTDKQPTFSVAEISSSNEKSVFFDEKVSDKILDIVRSAKQYILLVTPYLKLWIHLKTSIVKAIQRNVTIEFLVRKEEQYSDEDLKWLKVNGIELYRIERLHAKIYLNEHSIILSSMNILESSALNSREFAISIQHVADQQEIRQYVNSLKKTSLSAKLEIQSNLNTQSSPQASFQLPQKRSEPGSTTQKMVRSTSNHHSTSNHPPIRNGFCIRNHEKITFHVEKPLCKSCYDKWAEYKRFDYEEKYCHRCGKQSQTSVAKPLCSHCYKPNYR